MHGKKSGLAIRWDGLPFTYLEQKLRLLEGSPRFKPELAQLCYVAHHSDWTHNLGFVEERSVAAEGLRKVDQVPRCLRQNI